MTTAFYTEHYNGHALQYFLSQEAAQAVLDAVPYDERGEHTRSAPLCTSPYHIWRVDRRASAADQP